MNKKIALLGLSLVASAAFIMGPKAVLAYRGDPGVTGPNYSEDRHQSMIEAFENKDYNAWKELMGNRGRVTQVITEENFDRFAEAHALALEGKTEEANTIRVELGLGAHSGAGGGCGMGYGRVNR